MLILIISFIAAAIFRLLVYNRAEHRLHVKNLKTEQFK